MATGTPWTRARTPPGDRVEHGVPAPRWPGRGGWPRRARPGPPADRRRPPRPPPAWGSRPRTDRSQGWRPPPVRWGARRGRRRGPARPSCSARPRSPAAPCSPSGSAGPAPGSRWSTWAVPRPTVRRRGLAIALLSVATGSALFILSQYLPSVRGFSASRTGLAVTPLAVGVVMRAAFGGRAPGRVGYRATIVGGSAVTARGFAVLLALAPGSGYVLVALGLLLCGAGTGFASPAGTSTVPSAVPPHRAGMGSVLNNTHRQLGIAVGAAVLGGTLAAVCRGPLPGGVPEPARGSLGATATLRYASGRSGEAGAARDAFTQARPVTVATGPGCAVASALTALVTLRAFPRRTGPRTSAAGRTVLTGRAEARPRSGRSVTAWSRIRRETRTVEAATGCCFPVKAGRRGSGYAGRGPGRPRASAPRGTARAGAPCVAATPAPHHGPVPRSDSHRVPSRTASPPPGSPHRPRGAGVPYRSRQLG
ncbi:MFS transporter [Streptomyces sp. NPDC057702]|uniref:MFS transporter n=1 Tax=unclassified Streptomyces TaxID=2593676 RepID=UPI003679EA7F